METAYRIPKRLKGVSLVSFPCLSLCVLSPAQDTGAEDPSDDWVSPPSPPPENRQSKRSKLNDLVEAECAIKPLGFAPTRQFTPNSHRGLYDLHEQEALRNQEMHLARLARIERSKAEAAAIIAAAAAAQKAAEERAIVEAAAAAEEQNKAEERKAERERRRKQRKEGDEKRSGHGREDEREKRLLKLVGAVVVKTMSKYRSRMDVDTFKKHAKEVRVFLGT